MPACIYIHTYVYSCMRVHDVAMAIWVMKHVCTSCTVCHYMWLYTAACVCQTMENCSMYILHLCCCTRMSCSPHACSSCADGPWAVNRVFGSPDQFDISGFRSGKELPASANVPTYADAHVTVMWRESMAGPSEPSWKENEADCFQFSTQLSLEQM